MHGPFQSANQKLSSDNGSAPNPSCPLGGAGLEPHSGLATACPDTPPRLVGGREPFPDPPAWQASPRSGGARARHRTRGPGQPPTPVTLPRLWPQPAGFPRGRGGAGRPEGGGACVYFRRRPALRRQLGPDTVSDLRSRCVRCVRPQTLRAAAHPPRRDPSLRPDPARERLARWREPRAENPRSSAAPLLGKLKPLR